MQTSQHGGLATVCWPHLWRAGLRQAQVIRFTRLHVVRTLKSTHTHARTLFRPSSSSTSKYIITVFFPERGLGARGRFLRDFYEIIIITVSFTESYVVVERRIDGCYVVRCFELEERGNSKTDWHLGDPNLNCRLEICSELDIFPAPVEKVPPTAFDHCDGTGAVRRPAWRWRQAMYPT